MITCACMFVVEERRYANYFAVPTGDEMIRRFLKLKKEDKGEMRRYR